jgi:hypothetical protein
MSTTAKAADNGSIATQTKTEKSVPAQREHGMTRLREEECYYLTHLIRDSLGEAEHLVRKASNKAYNRTLDHDGSKGTAPLDQDEVRDILIEARDCAQVAIDYLYRAVNALDQGDAPF